MLSRASSYRCLARATDAVAAVVLCAVAAAPAWAVPDTSITSGPPTFTNSPNATFEFSATEPATFKCKLDAEVTFTTCTSPHGIPNLSEGSHTFLVRAESAAGGPDPTPATQTWTVDFTPPETTLTNAPPAQTSSPNATFEFTSNDPGASFECSLNGAPFSACSSPISFMGLGDGTRSFEVRARDQATNADISPASATWTVDATPPDTMITSGPNGPSNAVTPTFEFASSENGSTFECAVDGAPFAACASPFGAQGLADGAHNLQVRATDAVANLDPTPATRAWTRDTVAPPKPTLYVVPAVSRKSAVRQLHATSRWQTQAALRVYWSGAGAQNFSVAYKRITTGTSNLSQAVQTVNLVTNVAAGSKAFTADPGFTYCFVATAHDAAGNAASSSQVCTTLPHKANTMVLQGWTKHLGSGYYFDQYVNSQAPVPIRMRVGAPPITGTGASLPPVVKRVVLVATKCSTCGKVRVTMGPNPFPPNPNNATVNVVLDLTSATTKRRKIISVTTFPSANPSQNRRFIFVQRLTGTPRIEGLAFAPS